MDRNLTRGNPLNLLIALSIPQILSAILQLLYNTVDALVVGNIVGEAALAGVGLAQPINFLINSIMIGLSDGVSIIVGQYYGAKKYKEMRKTIGTAITSLVIVTLVFSLIGFLITDFSLEIINTPDDVFPYASAYLKIMFVGTIFTLMYNLYSGILRALGDARSPLIFLGIAAALNVILDIVFVSSFNMGTAGAAYATVISQGVSSAFCIFYVRKKMPILTLEKEDFKFEVDKFKLILRFGVPGALQMSIISIGNLLLQNLLNSYGTVAIAGYTAAVRIDSFIIMPYQNVGVALSNFTGQNIGAKLYDRVREGLRSAYKILIFISVIALPITYIFASDLVGIFLNSESGESIRIGALMLRDLVPFYIFLGLLNNTNGLLRGSGDNFFAMFGSLVSITLRVVCAYGLNEYLGMRSIWISQGIGWIVAFLVVYLRFKNGRWKEKGVKDI